MNTSMMTSSSGASGGPEEVEVSGRGRGIRIIDLPAVFSTPEEREMLCVITAFDLSRNELERLTNLQPLRSLTRLNVSYNRISVVDGLPLRLTHLNLAHNKLERLDPVGELAHLRELDVSFNRLTSLSGLHPRVPLEVVRADDNRIDSTFGLKDVASLRVVSLGNNYVESLDDLMFVATTPSLQLLSLVGNPVTRARRYRQTVAELQPLLVSLDGVPLARPSDYDKADKSSRVSSSIASPAAVHASPSVTAPRSTTSVSQRAVAQGLSDWSKEWRAAVEGSEKHTLMKSTQNRNTDVASSHRSVRRGDSCLHASIDASSIVVDDSPTARPRDQPPRPARRSIAGPTSRALRRPAVAGPRTPSSSSRCEIAGLDRHTSAAAESPSECSESPACVTQHTESAHGTSNHVESVVEDSQVGCRATEVSLRTPENGGRQVGYASLHCTPVIGGSADGPRGRGRGRVASSPASNQRTAISQQDIDSTTAQLHDSLVAKEQLEKECQALRQACKRAEGQLTEARRVISQQLAELSQLRLERDALRQSEGDALERLEKEKRSARARAAHHSEEVETLQAQYERMKTFYETQLSDTRRELAAERARLLRHRNNGGGGGEQRAAAGEKDSVMEKGRKLPLRDEGSAVPTATGDVSSTANEAISASLARFLSPRSRSAPRSPTEAENHDRSVTVPSTDTVAEQLTQWLYASGALPQGNLCPSLLRNSSKLTTEEGENTQPQLQCSNASSKDSAATTARRILEAFIAQHIAEPTRLPVQRAFNDASSQGPAVAVDPTDVGGGALSQASRVIEDEERKPTVVCSLPLPFPSPTRCPSPPSTSHISMNEDDASTDTAVTVVIAQPPSFAATGKDQCAVTADLPLSPPLPLPLHNERVSAARALLKGMESLFDTELPQSENIC